jgi:hypothetical protein
VFYVASSAAANDRAEEAYPSLFRTTTMTRSVLPSALELLTTLADNADDTTEGNRNHLYEFHQHSDNDSVNKEAEKEARLQAALATVLPRGMTGARQLVGQPLLQENKAGVCIVGRFCAEGDNGPDARQLGDFVLQNLLK